MKHYILSVKTLAGNYTQIHTDDENIDNDWKDAINRGDKVVGKFEMGNS